MNNSMPDKMSRTVLFFKDLSIKIHVKLYDDTLNFHQEFNYGNKKYLKLEPSVYLTMEPIKQNSEYDQKRNLVINEMNISVVIKYMNKLLNNLYTEKIFSIKDNNIIAYSDAVNMYTEKFKLPKSNQVVVLQPAVVFDENEVSYEGVRIYINSTDNYVDLSIEEFESVLYTLSHIDLFQYSQLLLNYMVIKYKDEFNSIRKNEPIKQLKQVDWFPNNQKSTVSSNFRKSSDDTLFEGLTDIADL